MMAAIPANPLLKLGEVRNKRIGAPSVLSSGLPPYPLYFQEAYSEQDEHADRSGNHGFLQLPLTSPLISLYERGKAPSPWQLSY